MNEPIISPWIFYWMDILTTIKKLPEFFVFIWLILAVACLIVIAVICSYSENERVARRLFASTFKPIKPFALVYLTITVLSMVVSVFLPNQETMYKMLITSQVTPNNVEYLKNEVKATGQGLVDSITEASIKIIKAKENK